MPKDHLPSNMNCDNQFLSKVFVVKWYTLYNKFRQFDLTSQTNILSCFALLFSYKLENSSLENERICWEYFKFKYMLYSF